MIRLTHNRITTDKTSIHRSHSVFCREISLALAIKFLILGILWWFFFAGTKQPVNDELVANRLLGLEQTVISSSIHQDKHQ